ncbi:MAG: hypothetical protein Q9162_007125 [Coniocarpon cinnabarinum]
MSSSTRGPASGSSDNPSTESSLESFFQALCNQLAPLEGPARRSIDPQLTPIVSALRDVLAKFDDLNNTAYYPVKQALLKYINKNRSAFSGIHKLVWISGGSPWESYTQPTTWTRPPLAARLVYMALPILVARALNSSFGRLARPRRVQLYVFDPLHRPQDKTLVESLHFHVMGNTTEALGLCGEDTILFCFRTMRNLALAQLTAWPPFLCSDLGVWSREELGPSIAAGHTTAEEAHNADRDLHGPVRDHYDVCRMPAWDRAGSCDGTPDHDLYIGMNHIRWQKRKRPTTRSRFNVNLLHR